MALIPCPECGKSVSDKARACPECGAPIAVATERATERIQEVVLRPAALVDGHKFGADTANALTNPRLALVWFVMIWLIAGVVLGYRAGLIDAEPTVWWYWLVTFVAPIPVAILLRRPIRAVVPVVLGSGCALLSIGFFVVIIGIAVMFVWNVINR
jgi:hypothetical protein